MDLNSRSDYFVTKSIGLLIQGVHRRALTKGNKENEDLSEDSEADPWARKHFVTLVSFCLISPSSNPIDIHLSRAWIRCNRRRNGDPVSPSCSRTRDLRQTLSYRASCRTMHLPIHGGRRIVRIGSRTFAANRPAASGNEIASCRRNVHSGQAINTATKTTAREMARGLGQFRCRNCRETANSPGRSRQSRT
jgi:hypothetical protein